MVNESQPDYANTPASKLRPRFGYAPAQRDAQPIVSVITPFFNGEALFHETAESMFRQSLQQWEWIVVDDGSDDPGADLLRTYSAKDSRIQVLQSKQRKGPAAARNLGVRAARCPYIALLDSDDLLEPTALEKWLWFLESHPQYALVKGFQAGFGYTQYIWRGGFHSGSVILERNLIQTSSMMRREMYLSVGGMDESICGGMEDWEFWLRCADAGNWGSTVPEVLDWYRRRASHNDRWENWDSGERQAAFKDELRHRYPRLFDGGFPDPALSFPQPYAALPAKPGFENRLVLPQGIRRVLMIVPHLAVGGSDQVALDLISELSSNHRYEITVATTLPGGHPWRHRFEALTPDVFTLDSFLRLRDYPGFLTYLIRSRQIESVFITHSQLGYQLLPYLRAECPGVRFYDYVHIEEPNWKEGGYPAFSLSYRDFLDNTAASSQHLKEWMVARGGHANKISVATTNIDTESWRRDLFAAPELRKKWNVPEQVPIILFVGRICDQKQPNVLAGAVRLLHQRGVRFLCLVVGDGEQMPWLREYVSRHSLTEVRLLGSRSLDDVRELLAISDIFFLPSRHEGISQALFEAMAMEAVPVAADVGGQRELVAPDCGVLISPGEGQTVEYADALESLVADKSRRAAMASASRNRVVSHFQLQESCRTIAEILAGARDTVAFDLVQAIQTFTTTYAREIIEQRRTELTADQLWSQRSVPVADEPLIRQLTSSSAASQPHLAATVLRALAILRPLFVGPPHRRNRQALMRVLVRRRARHQLLASFDADFYCCSNADIPRSGPLPLLHYIFIGYREGRRPSPDFESDRFLRAHPDPSGGETNPLLWKIILASDDKEPWRQKNERTT